MSLKTGIGGPLESEAPSYRLKCLVVSGKCDTGKRDWDDKRPWSFCYKRKTFWDKSVTFNEEL